MSPDNLVKLFLLSEVVWIAGLFIAFQITRVSFTFPRLLIIATLPTIIALFPIAFFFKVIGGAILTYFLIVKLTDAEYFPDAVLAVGVANVMYIIIGMTILTKFA
jgi:hypothetical protein